MTTTNSRRRRRWPLRAVLVSVVVLTVALTLAVPASAAPVSQGCPLATSPEFTRAAGADLGCATSEPFTTDVAEQAFEHGHMLWVAEWGTISVLWDDADGRYDAYDDLFDPQKPEPAPLEAADPNLIEPRQGFGKVWRQLGGPTSQVGWATAAEEQYPAAIQYFARGVAIQRPDGPAYAFQTFNHARGTWALVAGSIQ